MTGSRQKSLLKRSLQKTGNLVKVEDYNNKIGRSERTNAVIEPRLSLQWFLKMKDLSKPALDAVMNGEVTYSSCKIQKSLPPLDGECPRLVHKQAAMVGTPDTGMVFTTIMNLLLLKI